MNEDWYMPVMVLQQQELQQVLSCNDRTRRYGLELSEQEAQLLLQCRIETLKEHKRVEFGGGILPKLIAAFCDSQYIQQEEYADVLTELQDIFYLYKNESGDNLTDDEVITFMREQFDGVCFGSAAHLKDTCLERFARAVRAGYRGYEKSGGKDEYLQYSEEAHWDRTMYWQALSELL